MSDNWETFQHSGWCHKEIEVHLTIPLACIPYLFGEQSFSFPFCLHLLLIFYLFLKYGVETRNSCVVFKLFLITRSGVERLGKKALIIIQTAICLLHMRRKMWLPRHCVGQQWLLFLLDCRLWWGLSNCSNSMEFLIWLVHLSSYFLVFYFAKHN